MCSETDDGLTGVVEGCWVARFPCRKPWVSVCVVIQVSKTCGGEKPDIFSQKVFHSQGEPALLRSNELSKREKNFKSSPLH